MIKNLSIFGLKSVDKIQLKLKNLNLLTGTNSAGKSTIIQGLLLAVQNINFGQINSLNGHLVSLGEFREVRNYNTNTEEIRIEIKTDTHVTGIAFRDYKNINSDINYTENNSIPELNYNNKLFHYISSARIGSQDIYEKNIDNVDVFGLHGEYAIDYFEKNKNFPVERKLIKFQESHTLESQVNYWFKYIINGKLSTEDIKGTDKVRASFSHTYGNNVRPKNIGSGFSYIISILIICLASKENTIVVIENPEIHLHPMAQSRLAEFFAFISKSSIQLIIETHSDHIFNGLRVAMAKNKITSDEVSINYCELDGNQCTKNTEIRIGDHGRVLNNLDGLFDQFDHDINKMLGF